MRLFAAPLLIAALALAALPPSAGAVSAIGGPVRQHVPLAATGQSTIAITIDGSGASPQAVTITAGTAIQWWNRDDIPHTVSADDGSFGPLTIGDGDTSPAIVPTTGVHTYRIDHVINAMATIAVQDNGALATATATATPSATASPTTSAPTATAPSAPSPTATPTSTPTGTPTASPTGTEPATPTGTDTPTSTATATMTVNPTATASPSASATDTASPSASATNTPPAPTGTSSTTSTSAAGVTITAAMLDPQVITVTLGMAVQWTNREEIPVTLTQHSGLTTGFIVGPIMPRQSASYQFEAVGRYPYYVQGTTLAGMVVVQPAATPTIAPSDTPTAAAAPTTIPSDTPTAAATPTVVPSDTPPPSATIPPDTATAPATPTGTATPLATPTALATPAISDTPSDTPTATATPPMTAPAADTPTMTSPPANTPTTPASPTMTSPPANTPTTPASPTPTDMPADTDTATSTPSSTALPAATDTATPTATPAPTDTLTPSPTNTAVPDERLTATATPTSTIGAPAMDAGTSAPPAAPPAPPRVALLVATPPRSTPAALAHPTPTRPTTVTRDYTQAQASPKATLHQTRRPTTTSITIGLTMVGQVWRKHTHADITLAATLRQGRAGGRLRLHDPIGPLTLVSQRIAHMSKTRRGVVLSGMVQVRRRAVPFSLTLETNGHVSTLVLTIATLHYRLNGAFHGRLLLRSAPNAAHPAHPTHATHPPGHASKKAAPSRAHG